MVHNSITALHALRVTLNWSASACTAARTCTRASSTLPASSSKKISRPSICRGFATSVLHDASSTSSTSSTSSSSERGESGPSAWAAWGPRHAASDIVYTESKDFLESSFLDDVEGMECEYRNAGLTLPPRTVVPLHWPYSATELETAAVGNKPRRCDTLAHLVMTGDLRTARTVYDELKALHIGILRRSVYLSAAVGCIDGTAEGREQFLFWFNLIPNTPAVRPHPDFKNRFAPLIDALLEHHSTDVETLQLVLDAAGRKGVLPALIGPITRHLAYIAHPSTVVSVTESALHSYMLSTTAAHSASTSLRAHAHAKLCRRRTNDAWNQVVRSLAAAGWMDAAREVVEGRAWVKWTDGTMGALEQATGAPKDTTTATSKRMTLDKITRRAYSARVDGLPPSELVELLNNLEGLGRMRLVKLIIRRYERCALDGTTEAPWGRIMHARLIALRRASLHTEVINLFSKSYRWVGLPEHPARAKSTESTTPTHHQIPPHLNAPSWLQYTSISKQPRKLYPSAVVVTTVVPSLLHLLPRASILPFISTYLGLAKNDSTSAAEIHQVQEHVVAPQLRPTRTTSSAILREVCHILGAEGGLTTLNELVKAGLDPGLGSYNAIIWSLGGRGEFLQALKLIDAMENETVVHRSLGAEGEVITMPRPDESTLYGLVGIIKKRGDSTKEWEVLKHLVQQRLASPSWVQGKVSWADAYQRRLGA